MDAAPTGRQMIHTIQDSSTIELLVEPILQCWQSNP